MFKTNPLSAMRNPSLSRLLLAAIALLCLIQTVSAYHMNPFFERNANPLPRPARWGPPLKRNAIPLVISNNCAESVWPAIGTQAGTGAGIGGFALAPGQSKRLTVSGDWQGRVWGRTNCSFNVAGNGASNLNGFDGSGAACGTGDCAGVLNCALTGRTPLTLAEFDLAGGVDGTQTFYDISLVDGYNLPLQVIYIPGDNAKLKEIPPNLTNAACIATAGLMSAPANSGTSGNATTKANPLPYESKLDSKSIGSWCPWDLQVKQPTKPGDGVYPYPDDNIQRPIFDPCLSACAKSNAPKDCCTGPYDSTDKCKPGLYSKSAKAVCPDAYSFAFDDQTSTFVIPSGGGWEVKFCPAGRSTNIINTFKAQLGALGQGGITKAIQEACANMTIIEEGAKKSGAERVRGEPAMGRGSLGALVVVVAWAVLC
ncbi:Pathogenesis-related protein 5 [Lachnellula cervina]|uniref:Pathogenesis-related protein 5 n=1 Tax=Lachnellula cervina TaxID=1316786 RepID=A0A7D8YJH0_9HELO|nr:Pathogenesis-related protein 5 [Lachnellula cervina]